MNVCAVRKIYLLGDVLEAAFLTRPKPPKVEQLPHEPKSGFRFGVFAVKNVLADEDDQFTQRLIGDYAECKHCGCLYAEDGTGGRSALEATKKP